MSSFVALLEAFLSVNNAHRVEAETQYKKLCNENPSQVAIELLNTLCSSNNSTSPTATSLRSLTAVLLRRFVAQNNGWKNLSAQVKHMIKQQLLLVIESESSNPSLRCKIGHSIAEVASCVSQSETEESWVELLPFLIAMSQQNSSDKTCTALDVLKRLAEYAPEILQPHLAQLHGLYSHFVTTESFSIDVRVSAVKATVALIMVIPTASQLKPFEALVPAILKILEVTLGQNDEATSQEILQALVDVACNHPTFLRPFVTEIGNAMVFIAQCTSLEVSTRELALEFLLSLSEMAGGMVRKCPAIVSSVVPLAMSLMCEVDEDSDDWVSKFDDPTSFNESSTDDDDSTVSDTGAAAMDRISNSLGGKTVLPVVVPIIQTYVSDSSDWRKRRAAILTICLLGEGCKAQMYREVESFLKIVVPALGDRHERVRHAAVHCIGQMAEDFGEAPTSNAANFQARFHRVVVPALVSVLNTDGVLRNQALVGSALTNFCNPVNCRPAHVVPYLSEVLTALIGKMANGTARQVVEQVITAAACVARVVETQFSPYYDSFMPLAVNILTSTQGSTDEAVSLLRGKAMEAIALIGQSVGRERFGSDAHRIMNILLTTQQQGRIQQQQSSSSSEYNYSVESQYLVQACARIGSVLKEEFLPYIPVIMPSLMAMATRDPEVELSDDIDNEESSSANMQSMTVQVSGVGKKRLSINTTCLEEKTNACNMIYQYTIDLQGAFMPYINDVAQLMIPLLTYRYSESIRVVASLTMQQLMYAAISASEYVQNDVALGNAGGSHRYRQAVFDNVFNPLMTAFSKEEDVEALGAMAESISGCLEHCYANDEEGVFGLQSEAHIKEALGLFASVLSKTVTSIDLRMKENAQDEDFDEAAAEELEELEELEASVVTNVIDSIGWIIKTHKANVLPLVESVVFPVYDQMVSSVQPEIKSQAICSMDDIIEHCGSGHLSRFLPHLLRGTADPNACIRQAAAYGLGVCAEFAGVEFDKYTNAALEKLLMCINTPTDGDNPEEEGATDNAVSAVSKLCLYRRSTIDAAKLLPMWLTWLPLRTDLIEAREVHSRLVGMLLDQNQDLLGANFENLPQVLQVLANVMVLQEEEGNPWDEEDSVIDEETKVSMMSALSTMAASSAGRMFQNAWGTLNEEQQAVLNGISQ